MQVIYKNKNKGNNSEGAETVNLIIYIREISRYMEGEYAGRLKRRITRI